MSTHLKQTLALGLVLSLMACASYPTVNEDPAKNNQASFQKDALDCAKDYPEAGGGVHVKQRIACMNLKGWH